MIHYSIPMQIENMSPVMVIEHEGKYYSFGSTCRTVQSVWDEVKDKLHTLNTCDFTEEEIEDLSKCKVEEF